MNIGRSSGENRVELQEELLDNIFNELNKPGNILYDIADVFKEEFNRIYTVCFEQ